MGTPVTEVLRRIASKQGKSSQEIVAATLRHIKEEQACLSPEEDDALRFRFDPKNIYLKKDKEGPYSEWAQSIVDIAKPDLAQNPDTLEERGAKIAEIIEKAAMGCKDCLRVEGKCKRSKNAPQGKVMERLEEILEEETPMGS